MDWSECNLVEAVPGKVSGQPIVKGTRILADTIEHYSARGATVEEILDDFPSLTRETVLQMIDYVKTNRASAA